MNDLSLYANPRTFEEWSKGLHARVKFRKMIRWEIGDYLLIGEAKFGEKIWQVVDDTGFSEGDIRNMMSVCRKFPKDERVDLPWSWHVALAPIQKPERDELITQALSGRIGRAEIRLLSAPTFQTNGNGASSPTNGPGGDSVRVEAIRKRLCNEIDEILTLLDSDASLTSSELRIEAARLIAAAQGALREITQA